MKKQRSRVIAIVLAVVLVVAGVFAVMTVNGANEDGAATHYFYDQLTPHQTIFYNALKKMYDEGMLKTGTESLDVTDAEVLGEGAVSKELAAAYMNSNNPAAGNLLSDFAAARDAFYYDYPSIFYVDFSALSVRATSKGMGENAEYHIYICAERYDTYYTQGFENEQQVEEAITAYNEALDKLVEGARKVEVVEGQDEKAAQIGYVHDTLIRGVSYRLENACKPGNVGFIRTAYGALVCKEGVCEAYTRAFKAAMDKLGIPCVMVYGAFMHDSETPEDHIWDYVQLDGSWYGVDATMDDPISKKDFQNLPEGTDGYENREYFLAGADVMGRQHYPSGILSPANYEFTYPTLALRGYGIEAMTTDSALSVLVNYNGTDQDEGDTQATVFRVSYLGMGLQKCIDNGYYLLQRDVIYNEDTGEYDYGDWGYLLPEVYYLPGDRDEYIDIALSYNGLVQFGVTTRSPGNVFNQPNLLYYYGSESELLTSTAVLKVSSNYKVPPYPKTTTPTMRGDLMIGSTYTIDVEFTENLELPEGAEFKIDLECFYYERVMNSYGLYEKKRQDVSAGVTGSLLYDLQWDPATPNKISFKFRPSEYFAADSVLYTFKVKGLVGVDSQKEPVELSFGASHPCAVCALKSQGWDWNVFAKPQLIDNQDLSTEDWETADGEPVSDELTHRLTLVTTTTTQRESDTMNDLIGDELPDGAVQKSETYNIKLTLCKKQIIRTGQSVYISLGFPEGYGPDDAGVTFKAYHFKKDDAGNTIGVEEIPCIITEYGLIIKVDSFSPFAIAAVSEEAVAAAETATNVILTSSNGGSIASGNKGMIYELEGGSDTVKITADEGYVIDTLTINGTAVEASVAGLSSYELKISDENKDKHDNVKVSVTFVPETIHVTEVESGETVELPPQTEAHVHEWGAYQHDETGHYRVCEKCGVAEAKTPHTRASERDDEGKDVLPGDCTDDYECAVCKATVGGNAQHALTFVTTKDGKHYQQCANCEYKTKEEAHTFASAKFFTKEGHWSVCRCGATSETVEHDLVCVNCEDGTHRWECSDRNCGYTTAAIEHVMTLSKDSQNHWMECIDCGYRADSETHNFKLVSDEDKGHHSECEECGYKTEVVSHSGVTKSDATGHWTECDCGYKSEVKAHNATDDGDCTTELVCEDCKYVVKEAQQHDFSDTWTYVSDDLHQTVCENEGCNKVKTESHTWTHNKYNDTEHTRRCEVCGHSVTEPHSNWTIKKVEGDKTNHVKVCGVCGQEVSESHKWSEWSNDPETGKYTRVCTECGLKDEEDHKWGPWEDDENGKTHSRRCTVHEDEAKETQPHREGQLVENDDGTHSIVCADCGAVLTTEEHVWTADWTDTADGEHHARRCECGAVDIVEHNWSEKPVADQDGVHHVYTCDDCGATKILQHTLTKKSDADGHWDECEECGFKSAKVEHEFSYVSDGDKHHQICSCGYETAAEAHKWTYSDNGNGTHTATCVCGDTVTSDHSYGTDWTISDDKLKHEHRCEFCGNVESVEHTMVYEHDDKTHWTKCETCGYTTDKIAHALTNAHDATHHWAVCSDPNCGYTDEANKTLHTIKYGFDENGHWDECTECSYRTETVDHDLDKKNNETGHWDECECGYKTDVVAHTYKPNHDDTHHWNECECGYKKDVEEHTLVGNHDENGHWTECECGYKTATVAHTYKPNHDDTHHWNECECGYKKDVEEHTLVGNRDENGHWTECECGYKTATVAHTYKPNHDDTHHWNECECGHKKDVEEHTLVGNHDENGHWTECECGYKTATVAHTYKPNHDDTHHWNECECGYKKDVEEHTLVGNHDENGHWTECECGYKTATVAHTYKPNHDDTHHWNECECGYKTAVEEHDLVGKYDENGHWDECECGYKTTAEEHDLVGKYDENGHWDECECGYKTAVEEHDLVGKYDENGHWDECECGYKTAAEEHDLVGKYDENGHWDECECGYKTAAEEHSFKDGVCDCGMIDPNQPSESEPVETEPSETEPSETEPDTKPDTPPQTGDESSFMVWAVVVVISAGALVMIAIEFTKRGKEANR